MIDHDLLYIFDEGIGTDVNEGVSTSSTFACMRGLYH